VREYARVHARMCVYVCVCNVKLKLRLAFTSAERSLFVFHLISSMPPFDRPSFSYVLSSISLSLANTFPTACLPKIVARNPIPGVVEPVMVTVRARRATRVLASSFLARVPQEKRHFISRYSRHTLYTWSGGTKS